MKRWLANENTRSPIIYRFPQKIIVMISFEWLPVNAVSWPYPTVVKVVVTK